MAKKNTILFSVIIVVIIVAYVWLTDSNQWGQSENQNDIAELPQADSEGIASSEYQTLKITALAPPNATFDVLLKNMPDSVSILSQVEYPNDENYSYKQYVNTLLTEESGEIHLVPNEWVLPLAVQGYLMPLDRVLTSEYAEDQTIALVDSLKWNSSMWATPFQLNPYIVLPHQSLAASFSKAASSDATDENYDEIVQGIAGNEEKSSQTVAIIGDEEQSAQQKEQASFVQASFLAVIDELLQQAQSEITLVNANEQRIDELFHFLHAYERQGIYAPNQLTLKQTVLLEAMQANRNLVTFQSLDEIVEHEADIPLFLVVTWEDIMQHDAFVEAHYIVEQAIVPIHWANGYSFVIKQQTEQHQIAGQWLEALHREMSTMNKTIVGMPIHTSNLSRLQLSWQKNVAMQYNQQFDILSTMKVTTQWPTEYDRVDKQWEQTEVSDKLQVWLSQLNLSK